MPKLSDAERRELRDLVMPLVAEMGEVAGHIDGARERSRAVMTFLHDHMDDGQRRMQLGAGLEHLGLRPEMIALIDASARFLEAAAKIRAAIGQPPPMDDVIGWWK